MDYATSEHGFLTQFNPTKMFIDFFDLFGLVYDRKRYNHLVKNKMKKEGQEDQNFHKINKLNLMSNKK